jgi:hypothetical protein
MVKRTIGELEDELKARDKRIEELRSEVDELRDLIQRLSEYADDYVNMVERWKEGFDMVLTDDGKWTWGPFLTDLMQYKFEAEDRRKEYNALVQKHNELVRKWDMKILGGNPAGRPLAASEAQIKQVMELRNTGTSLRGIADETNLGLNTVRTIVDKMYDAGRIARRGQQLRRKGYAAWEGEEIEIEREPDARQKASKFRRQKHTIDALPKQAQRMIEDGRALIKATCFPGSSRAIPGEARGIENPHKCWSF